MLPASDFFDPSLPEHIHPFQHKYVSYDIKKYQLPSNKSILTAEDLDELLIHSVGQGSTSIFFKTDDYVRAKFFGKEYWVSHKPINHTEMSLLATKIYNSDAVLSRLMKGEAIDCAYVINRNNLSIRFRVNISMVASSGSEGMIISMRKIEPMPPALDYTEIPDEMIRQFYYPYGLILVVGATGQGKSHLMCGFLRHQAEDRNISKRIITLESPIEAEFKLVPQFQTTILQFEIPKHIVGGFPAGIRNAMRQEPNDIFVGEIRDQDTVAGAMAGMQAGHLVYGTLHANNVAAVFKRLSGWYEGAAAHNVLYEVVNNSRMIISQRLFPSLDGKRIAVREYLIFNEEIVDEIISEGIENVTSTVSRLVFEKGVHFAVHARQRMLEGKVDEKVVQALSPTPDVEWDRLDNRIRELKAAGNKMFQNNQL